MKESEIEKYLTRQTAKLGGLAVKHTSPGRAGDPDRLVSLPCCKCPTCGKSASVALVELKAPTQIPRPLQVERMAQWAGTGLPVAWVSSVSGVDSLLAALVGRRVE